MSDDGRLLRREDEALLESFIDETSGRFYAMLDCMGRIISEGISEGRFTEKQAHHDLDIALWVGYACNNIADYEHYCTACEWLSRVEDLASGCGTWYYRYANALMYTGKPRLAMEYLSRGVDEDPDFPWCWLTLGRLRAHYGDREGAVAAARRGLELKPGDYEFGLLLKEIDLGYGIDRLEFHYVDEENDVGWDVDIMEAFLNGDDEASILAEAVMGIVTDPDGLAAVKDALSPEGWIPDHPYCTYMMPRGRGQVLVTLAMNEAFLSKMPPEGLLRITEGLDGLETRARESLGDRAEGKDLYGLTIDRRMRPLLSFGGFPGDEPVVMAFDESLEPVSDPAQGGPFVAIVLLEEDKWDPEALKRTLASEWGIRCGQDPDGDSLVFEHEGSLAAFSIVHSPVPGGEAEENARNNYMWPEAAETVSRHRAHILVALVNHGCPAVEAAAAHVKMVASACGQPGVLGVYLQDTVLSPEWYVSCAEVMKEGHLPVGDMVWVGLYSTGSGINAYTRGMSAFCRDEMEIIGADGPPERIYNFLCDLINYVLENGTVLHDGDTVGYDERTRLQIERSPGLSVEGMSLKIERRSEDRPGVGPTGGAGGA